MFAQNEKVIIDGLHHRFKSLIEQGKLNPVQVMAINAFLSNIQVYESNIQRFKERANKHSQGFTSSKDSVEYKEAIETVAKLEETVRAFKALYQSLLEQTDNHKNFDINVYAQHSSDLNDIIHIFTHGYPDTDKKSYKTARELGLGYPFTSQTEEEKFAEILDKYHSHRYHQLTAIEESSEEGFTESGESVKDIVNDYRRLKYLISDKEREIRKPYRGSASENRYGVSMVRAWTEGKLDEYVRQLKGWGAWYPDEKISKREFRKILEESVSDIDSVEVIELKFDDDYNTVEIRVSDSGEDDYDDWDDDSEEEGERDMRDVRDSVDKEIGQALMEALNKGEMKHYLDLDPSFSHSHQYHSDKGWYSFPLPRYPMRIEN